MDRVLKLIHKFILWTFTVIFFLFSMAFLSMGGVASAVFGILVIMFVIPINKWQKVLSNLLTKKIKIIAVIVLSVISLAMVPVSESEKTEASNEESSRNAIEEESEMSSEIREESSEKEIAGVDDESDKEIADLNNIAEVSEDIESETSEESVAEELQEESSVADVQLNEESTFSIHFIDVGQADASLVECDGYYMLIDGGNKGDSDRIYSVLKREAVPKLDIVVGTHAHEDHIGGIPGAFNYTTADLTLCPVSSYESDAFEDFVRYAEQNGGGITIPSVGDTYKLGSAKVTILGVNSIDDTNNSSIVLRIDYGKTSFLFTGDAEREAEQVILDSGCNLSATLLKVGHHGSDASTTYPFLRDIMPQYAVISVGEENSYGHPNEDTLSRLRDAEVEVYRTDLQGDIVVVSDGSMVTVSVDRTVSAKDVMTAGGSTVTEDTSETEPEVEEIYEDQPEGTDYIVNINSGKFHYPSCASAKKMKESNKWYYTGTREELISQGYDPCGNCHP